MTMAETVTLLGKPSPLPPSGPHILMGDVPIPPMATRGWVGGNKSVGALVHRHVLIGDEIVITSG